MKDIHSLLANLHRPRLLIRAARIGAENYRRDGHLPRLLGYGELPRHGPALIRLMEIEAEHEQSRCNTGAGYSVAAHVDVLIAIIGEADQLRAQEHVPQLIL